MNQVDLNLQKAVAEKVDVSAFASDGSGEHEAPKDPDALLLRRIVVIGAPVLVLVGSILGAFVLVKTGPKPEKNKEPPRPVAVQVTPAQARIAVLMGVLKDVAPGERIAEQGAQSDEMYVLIRGRARIERYVDSRVTLLREMGRGDVVGEMGLIRRQPRSADVTALEECELLVVNDKFLATLKERYPRIAATVLFNLAHILSDRLDTAERRSAV